MAIRVGTSGWSYPSWRPGFYPDGAQPSEFLAHYASRFDTVELNTTGYRLASEDQFRRWADAVPEGFTFDDFMALMMLPEDATPTPDMPVIEYQPVAAIGLLGKGNESWRDVELPAGHYMAVCMFPDEQGMPHAMSGMYAMFDIA